MHVSNKSRPVNKNTSGGGQLLVFLLATDSLEISDRNNNRRSEPNQKH